MNFKSLLLTLSIFTLFSGCVTPAEMIMPDRAEFESAYLSPTPKVMVYLPENYGKDDTRYPVLYAHDGQNLFDESLSFSGEWELDENIEALREAGLLDEIIVVGVYNRGSHRIDDYTPSEISNEWVQNDGGNLSNYGKFLTEELKPYIDMTYMTLPERENTGIMGSSLGGLASFYLIGQYPETFSKAGVISPSFWWGDVQVTNDVLDMSFPEDIKIYIDGGWKEGADESSMISYMRLVREALIDSGLNGLDQIYYYEDPEGSHSEYHWAKRGKMPLMYFFGDFQQTVTSLELSMSPQYIGVGDESSIIATINFTNDMPYTLLNGDFIVDNTNISISNGTVTGVYPGTANIIFEFDGQEVSYPVTVLNHPREIVYTTVSVVSDEAVDGLTLEIYLEDGVTTNYTVALDIIDGNASAVLVRDEGVSMRFKIYDSSGRYAYGENGRMVKKNVSFDTDETIEISVAEWKAVD